MGLKSLHRSKKGESDMLSVTRDGVKPVDLVAEIFVEDDIYLILPKDKELREALLDKLNVERVLVERLGKEKIPGILFEKETLKVDIPDVDSSREVGYYCRL